MEDEKKKKKAYQSKEKHLLVRAQRALCIGDIVGDISGGLRRDSRRSA